MDCPNCSAAAEDGSTECAACGVVFEKWRRKQTLEQLRVEEPGAPAPSPSGEAAFSVPLAPLAGAGVLALVALAGFTSPSGRGVPPSSVALAGGFSLKAPEGWEVKPRECPAEGKCPAADLVRTGPDPAEALAEASGRLPVSLGVMVFLEGPRVRPGAEDALEAAYLADWRAEVDKFSPAGRRWLEADGLEAWRVQGAGPKHVREEIRKPLILKEAQAVAELRRRNPTASVITYKAEFTGKKGDLVPEVVVDPGEYREADYQVALEALLVSGGSGTLRLSCRAQDTARSQCEELLSGLAKGLNVIARPRRWDLWLGSPLKKAGS